MNIKDVVEASNNKLLKKTYNKLTNYEKGILTKTINEINNNQIQYYQEENINLRKRLDVYYSIKNERDKLKGFYWAINGQIEFYNITPDNIDGINEGLQYLRKKPDQVIQHYGDPKPKEKVIQHRKDNI